jgi:hypothetical protein
LTPILFIEENDIVPLIDFLIVLFTSQEVESDREIAIERSEAARATADVVVYSDASGRHGHLGAAAVLDESLETNRQHTSSGRAYRSMVRPFTPPS